MGKQKLTTLIISLKNLKKHSLRTKSLIAIVAVLAFAIFCGALLSQSLSLGTDYMSGRLAADIMVVPQGYTSNLQDTILRSRTNTFFMSENLTQEIRAMQNVQQVSPLLFIASLNAACCAAPIQIIGFEPETDFTIKLWMPKNIGSELGFGEVVIGSLINATVGEQVWLYGQPFKVAARLDESGIGFNTAIFMTLETAQYMMKMSGQTAIHPVETGKDHISVLFLKAANDADALKAAKTIGNAYPQTDVIVLKELIQNISSQLNNIRGLIYVIQGLLWLVSIMVMAIIFTFTTNERKREFGLFLTLGATRNKLKYLLMTETLIISVSGALCGVIAAVFIMYEFRMLIATSLGLPYIEPQIGTIIILASISLLLSVLTGLIACVYAVIRIESLEPHFMIREFG